MHGQPINLHVAIPAVSHCIVRKQAEVGYRKGKQTIYIAKYYKTELIKISIH